ncbi:MAG: hypothetical protein QOE65_406 [Solirubrobacteraceae bacterium]|jgi:hypothetical protein|nr:hypothetical protein [Solirubrobacteraceae bacterium]
MTPRAIASCLGAFFCLLILGCGDGQAERIPSPTHDLGPAKRFKDFSLYYLGPAYRGLPMTTDGAVALREYAPGLFIPFTYGQCTPDPGEDGGSCHPPVEILNYPACSPRLKGPPFATRLVQIRGVKAGIFYDASVFSGIRVATGRTVVVIHAATPARALAIARRLRSIDGRVSTNARLPGPEKLAGSTRVRLCGSGA